MLLDEVEQLLDPLRREVAFERDLLDRRVTVELLAQDPAGLLHASDLVGDMHGKADRSALLCERPLHGLADPPHGIRRKLVPHRPVELLDRANETEVALLDEVEKRHIGARVAARHGHHEPQIALDQPTLCLLVALVLAPRELSLLGRSEQPSIADLAHVETKRILGRLRWCANWLVGFVEQRFGSAFHATAIGCRRPSLEALHSFALSIRGFQAALSGSRGIRPCER